MIRRKVERLNLTEALEIGISKREFYYLKKKSIGNKQLNIKNVTLLKFENFKRDC